MCVIVHKPAGVNLARDIYANCWSANRDGAGFAVICPEKGLIVEKGFFSFEEFWRAFEPHAMKHAAVHFRIATHGVIDAFNCHPWVVDVPATGSRPAFRFAVVHNGILSVPSTKEKSDTGHFVDEILGPLLQRDPWWLDQEAACVLTEEAIGAGNKIVVMRNDGRTWTLNDSEGIEAHQCWFSNGAFRPALPFSGAYFSSDPRHAGSRFRGDAFEPDVFDRKGWTYPAERDRSWVHEADAETAAAGAESDVVEDGEDWTLTPDYRLVKSSCFADKLDSETLERLQDDAFAHLPASDRRRLVRYARAFTTRSGRKPEFDRDICHVELLRIEFCDWYSKFKGESDLTVDGEILSSNFMMDLHAMWSTTAARTRQVATSVVSAK